MFIMRLPLILVLVTLVSLSLADPYWSPPDDDESDYDRFRGFVSRLAKERTQRRRVTSTNYNGDARETRQISNYGTIGGSRSHSTYDDDYRTTEDREITRNTYQQPEVRMLRGNMNYDLDNQRSTRGGSSGYMTTNRRRQNQYEDDVETREIDNYGETRSVSGYGINERRTKSTDYDTNRREIKPTQEEYETPMRRRNVDEYETTDRRRTTSTRQIDYGENGDRRINKETDEKTTRGTDYGETVRTRKTNENSYSTVTDSPAQEESTDYDSAEIKTTDNRSIDEKETTETGDNEEKDKEEEEEREKVIKEYMGKKPSQIVHVSKTIIEDRPNVFIYVPSKSKKKNKSGPVEKRKVETKNTGSSYGSNTRKTTSTRQTRREVRPTPQPVQPVNRKVEQVTTRKVTKSTYQPETREERTVKRSSYEQDQDEPMTRSAPVAPASVVVSSPVKLVLSSPTLASAGYQASPPAVFASQPAAAAYIQQPLASPPAPAFQTLAAPPAAAYQLTPVLVAQQSPSVSFIQQPMPVQPQFFASAAVSAQPQPPIATRQIRQFESHSVSSPMIPNMDYGASQRVMVRLPMGLHSRTRTSAIIQPSMPKKSRTVMTQTQMMPTHTTVYTSTQFTPATKTTIVETDHTPIFSNPLPLDGPLMIKKRHRHVRRLRGGNFRYSRAFMPKYSDGGHWANSVVALGPVNRFSMFGYPAF